MNQTATALCLIGLVFAAVGCARQQPATANRGESIAIDTTVQFDFNKARIRNDSKILLNQVADIVKTSANIFLVLTGHTDRRGSDRYNDMLAERRARAVGSYLGQGGVGSKQMTFVSQGERELKDTGHTAAAHQVNRRVEIRNVASSNQEEDRRIP